MLTNFAGSAHPIFRGTLERGELRSKGRGKTSIHFNGNQNIELLLQIVMSVNQLSVNGAVADVVDGLPVGQRAVGKPKAPNQLDKVEIFSQLPEYIYHVGNEKELRSTVNHGLIPGGVSLKTGRQAVFFTCDSDG